MTLFDSLNENSTTNVQEANCKATVAYDMEDRLITLSKSHIETKKTIEEEPYL